LKYISSIRFTASFHEKAQHFQLSSNDYNSQRHIKLTLQITEVYNMQTK